MDALLLRGISVQNLNKLRSHRSFRVPVTADDKIKFALSSSKDASSEQYKTLDLVNLSLTGLGFYSRKKISIGQSVYANLNFKGSAFLIPGKITRINEILNDYGECEKYFCGLEFDVDDHRMSRAFIQKFVSSFSSRRLKDHLIELLHDEGLVNKQSSKEKISLLKNLYQDMRKFDELQGFVKVIFKETSRLVRAGRFHFYLIDKKKDELVLFDFEKEGPSENKFNLKGTLIEKVLNQRRIINTKFGRMDNDPLYSELASLFDIETSSLILIPIYDEQGGICAIMEFANKKGDDFFSYDDLLLCEILSFTITSVWKDFHREPLADGELEYLNTSEYELVGLSEETLAMKRFINSVKDTNQNVLILGEYGIGKKLFAQIIHFSGPRKQMGVGVINSHDILSSNDLDLVLSGDEEHVGKLELYTGGTIIIKDVCALPMEAQKNLFEIMGKRKDIRFITTSPSNLDLMVSENRFYLGLYELMAQKFVRIPALRDRKEDIVPLMRFFLEKICYAQGLYVKRVGPKIVEFFKNYDWPGNIQELKTAIDRLVLYHSSLHYIDEISPDVAPVIDVDLGQYKVFDSILRHVDTTKLQEVPKEDLESLYLVSLVEKFFENGESINDLSEALKMDVERLRQNLFHGQRLYKEYFGIELKEIDKMAS